MTFECPSKQLIELLPSNLCSNFPKADYQCSNHTLQLAAYYANDTLIFKDASKVKVYKIEAGSFVKACWELAPLELQGVLERKGLTEIEFQELSLREQFELCKEIHNYEDIVLFMEKSKFNSNGK